MVVEIREPDCPRCGQPPKLVVSAQQAFCGNEACDAFCWDMTKTRAENEADVNIIDLSVLPHRQADDHPDH